MMQVILSVPTPAEDRISVAMILSNISSTILVSGSEASDLAMASRVWPMQSSEVKQSQIPSQARTMNESAGWRATERTSGSQVTYCWVKGKSVEDLYSKSPIERDKLRLPFTRFSSTNPPAASILAFSGALSGLWSSERGKHI